jgi:sortase A
MVIGDVSAPPKERGASAAEPLAAVAPVDSADPAETAPTDERAPAPEGPPRPGVLVIVLAVVLFVSVVVAFLGVFAYGLSGLQEHRSQQQLYAEFRQLLPGIPNAPSIGGHIAPGTPVALLNAPAAGIHNVMVVEGTSSGDLLEGPGHLPDTPLPGQGGEAVLVGKSTTAGAPFAHVTLLRKGDLVTVRTGQGLFRFTVEGKLVPGTHQAAIPADRGRLVLVTSAGTGGLAATQLVYVEARLQGKAVAAPPHRPTTVSASDVPGQADPGAWPFVVLWLAGLAAASAAVWWLWSRWGLLRTWLVGAPVLLALLWALSNEAMRLLPNVY